MGRTGCQPRFDIAASTTPKHPTPQILARSLLPPPQPLFLSLKATDLTPSWGPSQYLCSREVEADPKQKCQRELCLGGSTSFCFLSRFMALGSFLP